jgi:hypothetical protein
LSENVGKKMNGEVVIGLLIPFDGTSLGAAGVIPIS